MLEQQIQSIWIRSAAVINIMIYISTSSLTEILYFKCSLHTQLNAMLAVDQ